MLEKLFGNVTLEKVLFYICNYDEGYAQRISDTFGISLNMVQAQLAKLEAGGILASSLKGKTRMYTWNPRYPMLKELKSLLLRAMEYIPESEIKKYYRNRTRPRRQGKPL